MKATIHEYIQPVSTPNGTKTQEGLQESLPSTSGWRRFLPSPEKLMVAAREVKGFVVPQWAAGVILATILGVFGLMYTQNQTQKEMLIRLDQRLQDKNDRDKEKYEALELSLLKSEKASQDAVKELAVLKGMLGASNQKTLDRLTKN